VAGVPIRRLKVVELAQDLRGLHLMCISGSTICRSTSQYSLHTDRARSAMLEIGVYKGGSLADVGGEYLHPEFVHRGLSTSTLECERFDDPALNIHVRIGPQQDTAFLREGPADEFAPFDVILDDGSHMNSHMIGTFQWLFPHALNEVACTFVGRYFTPAIGRITAGQCRVIRRFHQVFDRRHARPLPDRRQ